MGLAAGVYRRVRGMLCSLAWAAALEPDNISYRSLVQQLESGGSWYRQRQASYGYPTFGGGDLCMKLCCLEMMCNLCCCGGGYGVRGMVCC